jgi:hypothetical protein
MAASAARARRYGCGLIGQSTSLCGVTDHLLGVSDVDVGDSRESNPMGPRSVRLAPILVNREIKQQFLQEVLRRLPTLRRSNASQSLFEVPGTDVRLYLRYSKMHGRGQAFFGLRDIDLRSLEGRRALICFLWDGQPLPLLLPYAAFEAVFASAKAASDGQFKVQIYPDSQTTELYVAGMGRYNVDGYLGWRELDNLVSARSGLANAAYTHSQIQTLLGAIGHAKGNDVWVPASDRVALDWALTPQFSWQLSLPQPFVWIMRGSSELTALFEIEHSTPVYSGLLRFNDVHLNAPNLRTRFSIVANDARRDLFARQVNRPTFQRSGLSDLCTFMEYANVVDWHRRIINQSP